MRVIKVLGGVTQQTVTFFKVLLAQSDADYTGHWMKAAVASKGKVKRQRYRKLAKDGPGTAALKPSRWRLRSSRSQDYWSKKGAADAVGFAKR